MTKVVSDLLTNVDSGSPSLLLSLDIIINILFVPQYKTKLKS